MPRKRKAKAERINTNLKKRSNPGRSNASTNPFRTAPGKDDKKGTFFRTRSTMKLLQMKNSKPDLVKMRERPSQPARIEPDPKWFGNTRTIDQKTLEKLRVELKEQVIDSYSFVLNKKKLPMSLIQEDESVPKINVLDYEKFEDTFGPNAKRKKPKLNWCSIEELAESSTTRASDYNTDQDPNFNKDQKEVEKFENRDKRIDAGQSKRIWVELYKVLDSSDVVVIVLDARNPNGTRCRHVESHLRKNCPTKHMVFVLNKVDLVPTHVTKKWIIYLSKIAPTIAFTAKIDKPFGKHSLIRLLRQFDTFHNDKKCISVGLVGYPNVGKSSVINSLKSKVVCKSAPIPGETKVWQYVSLTKRIYLIDCPGVVYENEKQSESEIVLKGVVRAERLEDPDYYIEDMLKIVDPDHMITIYGIPSWTDANDFLEQHARKNGKLLKGGEPDVKTAAKMLIYDWQRGKIPYYMEPPEGEYEKDLDSDEERIEKKYPDKEESEN